jgi:hypothetical protein
MLRVNLSAKLPFFRVLRSKHRASGHPDARSNGRTHNQLEPRFRLRAVTEVQLADANDLAGIIAIYIACRHLAHDLLDRRLHAPAALYMQISHILRIVVVCGDRCPVCLDWFWIVVWRGGVGAQGAKLLRQ